MTNRENTLAILNYEKAERMPLIHFGFWQETLIKWAEEGHISHKEAGGWADGNKHDLSIGNKLGFDFNWARQHQTTAGLLPPFVPKVLERFEDGTFHSRNAEGVIVKEKKGVVSIPAEIDHLLKSREDWEKHFKHRLQPKSFQRLFLSLVPKGTKNVPFYLGGRKILRQPLENGDIPSGLHAGSLIGTLRNIVGVENLSYLTVDDPGLLYEMIDAFGDLSYGLVRKALESGAKYDFLHFWEDICYNHGPLVNPVLFRDRVAPHYKRIMELAGQYGVKLASVDCDGKIDDLVPYWLENGINVMFPIEVGTWRAEIKPWREKYGKELRGVGGMDKVVFSRDKTAVDQEIERLKPLVELGGYIPCPDHRIAPDAKWENVKYYCERMRQEFN